MINTFERALSGDDVLTRIVFVFITQRVYVHFP
jgi:hypothetical protein